MRNGLTSLRFAWQPGKVKVCSYILRSRAPVWRHNASVSITIVILTCRAVTWRRWNDRRRQTKERETARVEIIKYDTTNVREVDVRTYIRARFRVSFHLALFIATDLIIYCSWRPAATVSTHARRHGGGWRGREAERDASLSSLLALPLCW